MDICALVLSGIFSALYDTCRAGGSLRTETVAYASLGLQSLAWPLPLSRQAVEEVTLAGLQKWLAREVDPADDTRASQAK